MKRSAREIALQALLRVNLDQGYSNLVLDNLLKDSGLDGRDTALASALFYGVLERKLTLDFILAAYSKTPLEKLSPEVLELLRLGTYQLLFMDKIPPSAAVNETVRLRTSGVRREPPLCQRRSAEHRPHRGETGGEASALFA